MTSYRVTFERIGRNHDVAALDTGAENTDGLATAIYTYVRKVPHGIGSREMHIIVDLDLETGSGDGLTSWASCAAAASFTIERSPAEVTSS